MVAGGAIDHPATFMAVDGLEVNGVFAGRAVGDHERVIWFAHIGG
jgi:hypothetical protein